MSVTFTPASARAFVPAAMLIECGGRSALDRAYPERSDFMVWLKVHAAFDPLRADRHFGALLRGVGLPPAPVPRAQ